MDEIETLRAHIRELEARARAQEKLESSLRERLESVTRNAPDYIMELDRSGRITFMNRSAPDRSLDEIVGTSAEQWMQEGARRAFVRALAHVFEHGEPAAYESTGSVTGHYFINRIGPVFVDGKVERAVLITHDVSELKAAELRLRESEEWFRTLVDGYFDAMAVSEDGRVIQINAACAALFGYQPTDLIGLTAAEMTTHENALKVMDHIRRCDEAPYEVVGKRKDGTTFPAEVHGRNVSYRGKPARLSFFRDLTAQHRAAEERQRLEHQMQDAQKLETLGVLAGGIAHDFNNLLQVILGNVELATLELPGDVATGSVRGALDHARSAALRASELVHQMLAYSGKSQRSVTEVDVSDVVIEIADLLLVSISKNTEITLELPDGLPVTRADAAQLRQVVMNLITNASEALQGRSGRVRLRVGRASLDPEDAQSLAVVAPEPPRDSVFVEVSDDGVGMSEDEIRKIFDPFFSTKFAGRGLGLASVAGIVRAHGGAIQVVSTPGRGSTFTVYLPAAEGQPVARASESEPRSLDTLLSGRVLLADDEPRLLELLGRSLRDAGLTVTAVRDGREALSAVRAAQDRFDVVVLDLTMPQLGGLEALREMRRDNPGLPAILLSGFTDVDLGSDLDPGLTLFLGKPFQGDALIAALQQLLPAG